MMTSIEVRKMDMDSYWGDNAVEKIQDAMNRLSMVIQTAKCRLEDGQLYCVLGRIARLIDDIDEYTKAMQVRL